MFYSLTCRSVCAHCHGQHCHGDKNILSVEQAHGKHFILHDSDVVKGEGITTFSNHQCDIYRYTGSLIYSHLISSENHQANHTFSVILFEQRRLDGERVELYDHYDDQARFEEPSLKAQRISDLFLTLFWSSGGEHARTHARTHTPLTDTVRVTPFTLQGWKVDAVTSSFFACSVSIQCCFTSSYYRPYTLPQSSPVNLMSNSLCLFSPFLLFPRLHDEPQSDKRERKKITDIHVRSPVDHDRRDWG